jgi:hypothetical protein
MGQATQAAAAASTTDLPDPTEPGLGPSASQGGGVGTDDLLAQLAGDEIDRLLAEAEVERPSARQAGAAPKAISLSPRPGDDDDALLPSDPFAPTAPAEGLTGDAFVPTAPADGTIVRGSPSEEADDGGTLLAAAEATEDPALSQVLDALFANLDAKAAPTPAAPPPAAAAAAVLDQLTPGHFPQARTQATAPAVAPPPTDLDDVATSAAERAALDAELEESATEVVQAAVASAEASVPQTAEDGRVPFYVRVLEWINAPLAACSDATRELIGKIALLTLVNALAVLVYVLFVR